MHSSGWVHRDISAGNIFVDDSSNARIGDLEYAKKYLNNESMDNKRKHDVRTVRISLSVISYKVNV